ncbi:MAG: hypothetical protein GF364_20470 [Candidatus Lokiarchaeota archaeon]|nr:hypothetical protein [Candidatus Lokiarchaeota archaeon]
MLESNLKQSCFIVHGRNTQIKDELVKFLRSINIECKEFIDAVNQLKDPNPMIYEMIASLFDRADCVIILMTPDEKVQLRDKFWNGFDSIIDKDIRFQPRPNVIFEAGLAFGINKKKTILVKWGDIYDFSDISGMHFLSLNNSRKSRSDLIKKLKASGLKIKIINEEWLKIGEFGDAVVKINDSFFSPLLHTITGSKTFDDYFTQFNQLGNKERLLATVLYMVENEQQKNFSIKQIRNYLIDRGFTHINNLNVYFKRLHSKGFLSIQPGSKPTIYYISDAQKERTHNFLNKKLQRSANK